MNKKLLKKLVSLAGVASASAFLCVPSLALSSPNASGSNQRVNIHTEQKNSTVRSVQGLAQANPGSEPSTTGGSDRNNQPSTTGGSTNDSTGGSDRVNQPASGSGGDRVYQRPSTDSTNQSHDYSPANSNGGGMRALTGGDSVRGIDWRCLNNPQCGRSM